MNTNEPHLGGDGGTPPAPVAVQQTTVIQVGTHKSVVGAALLAFLFGPLGMIYATIPGAVVMFFISIIIVIPTLGLGLLITIPIGTLWAALAANSHNKQLSAVSAQMIATGQVASPPAPNPAPPAAPPAGPPAPPPQIPPHTKAPDPATAEIEGGREEDVTVILKSAAPTRATCGSCGGEINPGAKFCSACGAAQTTA
jgi:hypothetical protein